MQGLHNIQELFIRSLYWSQSNLIVKFIIRSSAIRFCYVIYLSLKINCFFSLNSHVKENKVDAQLLLRPQCVSHIENDNSGDLCKRGMARNTLHSLGSSVIIPRKYFAHRPYYYFPQFKRNDSSQKYPFQKLLRCNNHDSTQHDVSNFAHLMF